MKRTKAPAHILAQLKANALMSGAKPSRPPKYGNKRVNRHGLSFDSVREANRYDALILLQRGGVIRGLALQVRHPLECNGVLVGKYVADFDYEERQADGSWLVVTEDAKGVQTDVFKLKSKMFTAMTGRAIRLT